MSGRWNFGKQLAAGRHFESLLIVTKVLEKLSSRLCRAKSSGPLRRVRSQAFPGVNTIGIGEGMVPTHSGMTEPRKTGAPSRSTQPTVDYEGKEQQTTGIVSLCS